MHSDVVIIGGGSAGQQAALTLGRFRFDVVVVDAGMPSNAPAHVGRTGGRRHLRRGDLVAAAPAVVQALATAQRAAVGIVRDSI